MKILVTGGGGFLGGAIVRKLVEKGCWGRSFSRSVYPDMENLGVEHIQGDIADPKAVSEACQNIDAVFHTAAKPGVWGPYSLYYQTNVVGTQNVINACIKNEVSILVYTSSPSVIFNGSDMNGVNESIPYPETYHAHYPKTKALAEQKIVSAAKTGLKCIILRPHLIWGPGDNHLVPRVIARAKRLRRIGNGSNLVDTTYIDNAADAHILAAEKLIECPELSGSIYFISQDEPIPLWDMINAILKARGLPPVTRSISVKTAHRIGSLMEWTYRVLGLESEPPLTRFVAEELASSHWFDITAAKTQLGYIPKISTAEGLQRLEKWLRENARNK